MDSPRLSELLTQLHAELAQHPEPDPHRRALLLDLQTDVERLIPRTGGGDVAASIPHEERQRLQGRLQQIVVGWEGAHPRLAAAVEQTMVALSNLGL